MNPKRVLIVVGLLIGAVGGDLGAAATGDEAGASAKLLATQVCSDCHGGGGPGVFSAVPNLAAQPWPYLLGKLRAFRDRANGRSESHIDVLGLTLIDDATETALAHYFADQPPPAPVAGDPALIAAGEKIFTQGDSARGIASCAACHGMDAAGFWIFPRLAGQRAEYVKRALRQIQSRLRDSRVMHGLVKNMTAADIEAVATFVQSK